LTERVSVTELTRPIRRLSIQGQAVEKFWEFEAERKGELTMVYTIIVVLLVLWLLGFSLSVGGNLIHALLFMAAVVLLYNFLHRRGRWV